ncbi:MurR/RpiR family transcriptional regulator [Achromobacter insuavis]
MNLHQRIAAYDRKLTKTEQRLVEDMQARYPQGLLESATALARQVGTSASTVVRLLAKLGYDSYAQAQMQARAELTALLASPGERADAVSVDNPSAQACLRNALLHDQHNLETTFAAIDVAAFEAAVRLLTQRRARVHVLGLRQAAPLANHMALYLNLCLPDVKAMAAPGPLFLEDQLLWLQPHDVLLAFTFRRYSVAAANAVKVFRERGGKVVLITDSAAAPAARRHTTCCWLARRAHRRSIPMWRRCRSAMRCWRRWRCAVKGTGRDAGARRGLWDSQWIHPPAR